LAIIRNPFSTKIKGELNEIIEPVVNRLKKTINVRYVDNAATFIDAEALKIREQMDEDDYEKAFDNSNLKDFSKFLEENKLEAEKDIVDVLKTVYPTNSIELSGSFLYPDTGYMGWHTNHDEPCKRLYIVHADEEKASFFRYVEDGNIITDFDNKGLTIREFDVYGTKPYFWHCVGSTCNRFSFGFRIEKEAKVVPT